MMRLGKLSGSVRSLIKVKYVTQHRRFLASKSTGDGNTENPADNEETAHNKTFNSYSDDQHARYNAFNELQVGDNASLSEIKQRWLKLSAEMHPDRNPGDPHALERFKKIQVAWADILENKKMVGGDGQKSYICPDTLEEFKYDIEVRPIGLVETIEVNKIDKHHTQPWDGTQNFGVLDPIFNLQLWSPGLQFIERMFYAFVCVVAWGIYSYYNNGIVADRLGNLYGYFDLEEELVKDDPSEKFKFVEMRQRAGREIRKELGGRGVDAPGLVMEEADDEEEKDMIKMLEEMGIK